MSVQRRGISTTSVGWLAIMALVSAPYTPPPYVQSTVTPSEPHFSIDNKNGMVLFVIPDIVEMKAGDSNETIATQKAQAELAKTTKVVQAKARKKASGEYVAGRVQELDSGKPEYYNCVDYVRTQRYMPRTANGNAGTTPINGHEPVKGAIAVMAGHVAIVEGVEDGLVVIRDANYERGVLTRRWVSTAAIKGYYN